MHRLFQRVHNRYWDTRAYVEGWVLLTARHGPGGVWRRLTRAPTIRPVNFPWSRISEGYGPGEDVKVDLRLWPLLPPDPLIISARRIRAFVYEVCPTTPPNPRLDAAVAVEQEHGVAPLTGSPFSDTVWTSVGGVRLCVVPDGGISFQVPSIRRAPDGDDPLFDLVDVLWPVYLATMAISIGAYDRLLGRRSGRRLRYAWNAGIGEEVVFPTPLAGRHPIAFRGRTPAPAAPPRPVPHPPREGSESGV